MKPKLVILALLCVLVSVGRAQSLEKMILLPDSVGSIANPRVLVWDSIANRVFVGGDSGVVAIDGGNNLRVVRIWTGLGPAPCATTRRTISSTAPMPIATT